MSIDILLATYNGAKWLPGQIDSLLAQNVQDWRLLVRDDGSSDATIQVVDAYQKRNPERIRILDNKGERLGPAENFAALLAASDAPYAMCCDQDDVWMPDKIAHTLETMRALEKQYGANAPLLVHTDALITDAALAEIAPSFARHHGYGPQSISFNRLLVQNAVHGCTLMANRALLSLAMPMPQAARMHDIWLALVASACGHIAYLDKPTLLYRQHGGNAIAASKFSMHNIAARTQKTMLENLAQAEALLDRFGERLPSGRRAALEAFITMKHQGWVARKITLLRYGFLRRPWWQNTAMLLFA